VSKNSTGLVLTNVDVTILCHYYCHQ